MYPNATADCTVSLPVTAAAVDTLLRVALAAKGWFHGHQSLGDITLLTVSCCPHVNGI
jgi:hypothetical protein